MLLGSHTPENTTRKVNVKILKSFGLGEINLPLRRGRQPCPLPWMELVLQAGHRLQYFRVTELRFLSGTFSCETQLFPSLNAPATALSLPIASFSHPIPKELAKRRSKAEKRIKRRVPGHMHWIVCCPPAFNEANSGVNAAEHWKSYQSNWMEIVLSSQIPCWAQVLKQGWQD